MKGEPVGVQRLPTFALPHPARVPVPGAIFVRSNTTGLATPVVNIVKLGTLVAPVTGPPVRLIIVPPVSPLNEPVSIAPVVFVKLGLKLIDVSVTDTLPAMFASPVIGAACATLVSSEHDIRPRPRTNEGFNLMCI